MLSVDSSTAPAFSSALGRRPITPLKRDHPNQSPVTPRSSMKSHVTQPSPSLRFWPSSASNTAASRHRLPVSPRSPLVQRPTSPQQLSPATHSCYDSNPRSPRTVFSGSTSPLYCPNQQQSSLFLHSFNPKNTAATTSSPTNQQSDRHRYASNNQPLFQIYAHHQPVISILNDSSNGSFTSPTIRQSSLTQHLSSPTSRDVPTSMSPSALLAGAVSPVRVNHAHHYPPLTPSEMKRRQLAVSRVAFNQHRLRVKKELEELDDSDAPCVMISVSKTAALKSVLQRRRRKDSRERSCSSKHVRFSSKSSVMTFSIDSPPIKSKAPDVPLELPLSPRTEESLDDNTVAITPPAKPSARPCTPVPHLSLSSSPFAPALNRIAPLRRDRDCPVTPPLTHAPHPPATITPPPAWRDIRQPMLSNTGGPLLPAASIATSVAWVPPETSPAADPASSPQSSEQGRTKKSRDNKKKPTKSASSASTSRNEKSENSRTTRTRKTSRPDEYALDPSIKSASKRRTLRNRTTDSSTNRKMIPTISTIVMPMFETQSSSETQTSNEGQHQEMITAMPTTTVA